MYLGRNFELKKTKHGVELRHRTEGHKAGSKEVTIKWVPSYHGTLYHALWRALDLSIDPTKDFGYIMEDIAEIMTVIEDSKEELKKNFRTEVLIER